MIPHRFLQTLLAMLSFVVFTATTALSQTINCSVSGQIIWVTTAADAGQGSLREAIICANNIPGPNTIRFSISGNGNKIIYVGEQSGEPLPAIIDGGTVIDGTSQNGFGSGDNYAPKIVLDGSRFDWTIPINAITVLGDGCEIYSLKIRNFPDDGIDFYSASDGIIGAPNKGNVIINCGAEQDYFPGTTPEGPWNGCGIVLRNGSSNCKVQGNYIGVNENLVARPNEFCGIIVRSGAHDNQIGGELPAEGNVIAHNEVAIWIDQVQNVSVRSNSMFCNSERAIYLRNNANANKAAPTITHADTEEITGKASPGDHIQVFINDPTTCEQAPCQGKTLVGSIIAFDSVWTLTVPENVQLTEGNIVTATATDLENNTSIYSGCRSVVEGGTPCAGLDGTIWVTTDADDGTGSLRAAIECANSSSGSNTIRFNIPGTGRKVIHVGSTTGQPLPTLTDIRTVIDGTTQPGFGDNGNYAPQIILDGSQHDWTRPENAIWVQGTGCEIYGLEIRNFPDDGIDVAFARDVIIGAPNKGNVIYNCGIEQDIFSGVNPPGPWEGCGIVVRLGARNCTIQGNILGTNYSGSFVDGNEYCGIVIQNGSDDVRIGGANAAQGNTIAYNTAGVRISNGSQRITIRRNSFLCNDTLAIGLLGSANSGLAPPEITTATSDRIAGTAGAGEIVEVYLVNSGGCENTVCQGSVFLGTTTANGNGSWEINAPFANDDSLTGEEIFTATATDSDGNTSPFATCVGGQSSVDCSTFRATIASTQRETCDQNNGSFTLNVEGGTAPFQYTMGGTTQSSATFSNLTAGTYAVTVTDANSCEATQAVAINSSSGPTLTLLDVESATCGQPSGTFSVLAFGGVAPYVYDIGDGVQSSPVFESLSPGNYTVTVTDATGCASTVEATIDNVEGIEVTISEVQDAQCGDQNGSFLVDVEGGVTPIIYDIGTGQTTEPLIGDLAPGNYSVTVTDANGCSATHDVTINETPAVSLFVDNLKNANCGSENGIIEISSQGGTAPVVYDIGNGPTQQTRFENLSVGTYTITATDAIGCTDVQTVNIDAVGDIEVTISNVEDANCGENRGSFTAQTLNGTAPFTYDIGNGPVDSPTFENLAPGNYTVVAVDANGCSASHDVTINATPALELSVVDSTNAGCAEENGSITVSATGGTAPIIFNFGNGNTLNTTIEDLAPGDYTVTATDVVGCVSTQTVTIESSGQLALSVSGLSDATCSENNGAATIAVSNGVTPYEYNYGAGATTEPLFTDLAPGDYTVTVTDASGCAGTQDFTINSTDAVELELDTLTNADCGATNGTVTIKALSGTGPFAYNIGDGFVESGEFTDLSPGDYIITTTDALGCSATMPVTIESEGELEAQITALVDASCELDNGAFTIQAITGTAPFTYDIGNGPISDGSFSDLSPGNYVVTVSDAGGCISTTEVTIDQPTQPVAIVENVEDANCGEPTGSFTAGVSGGTAPYFYSIGDGVSMDPTFTGLTPGDYTVTVTDANGCTAAHGVTIQTTPLPSISITGGTPATCGNADGSFRMSVEGGIEPIVFDIGNGTTADTIFENLAEGSYTITAIDALGCTDTEIVSIESSSEITASIIEQQNTTCGETNGSFQIVADGGVTPYSYDIGNGSTAENNFTGLSSGTYTVTVADANGCTTTETVSVANSSAFSANITAISEAFCGQDNGAFTVEPVGGQAPFSYNIGNGATQEADFSNLSAGTYTVTVTDDNNCTFMEEVIIEEGSGGPTVQITNQEDSGCNDQSGSFRVIANGGEAPYSYNIGNGPQIDPTFRNLAAAVYQVTVTDANDCETVQPTRIFKGDSLDVYQIGGENPICNEANGTISVAAANGVAPYQFSINDGTQNNGLFRDLAPGTYTITATDTQGCESSLSVTLTNRADPPELTLINVFRTSCGNDNGQLQVQPTGGKSPYRYDIGNGQETHPVFENLSAGEYTVTVTDDNGCTNTISTDIGASSQITVTTTAVQDAECGTNTGSFSLEAVGDSGPYFYNIGNGRTRNNTFDELAPGTYQVTVTNNICTTVHPVTVNSQGDVMASAVDITQPTCTEENGSFTVIVDGGEVPYTFNVGEGPQAVNVFTGMGSGDYAVTVTDAVGCTSVATAELTNEGAPPIANFQLDSSELAVNVTSTTIGEATLEWDFGDGATASESTVEHSFDNLGSYTICLTATNDCGSDTHCEEIAFSEAKARIAGKIITPTEQAVGDVLVTCTGANTMTTGSDGLYDFQGLTKEQSYSIIPEKDINLLNGVSTFDLYQINNHILGRTPLDSPYKIIAADANNSGSVTTSDLVAVQRVILGVEEEFPNNKSWRFIDAKHTFADPTDPLAEPLPEQIDIMLTTSVLDADFIGIKIGDVNQNVIASNFENVQGRTRTNQPVIVPDHQLEAGQEIVVPLQLTEIETLLGLQFTLEVDVKMMDIVDIIPGNVGGVSKANFNLQKLSAGILTASWYKTQSAPSGDALIYLKIKAKQALQLREALQISSAVTPAEAYVKEGSFLEERNLILQYSEPKAPVFKLYQNTPNPFRNTTQIGFELPKATPATFTIYDATGKVVKTIQGNFTAGYHQITLDSGDWQGTGLYYYRLETADAAATRRLIVVE